MEEYDRIMEKYKDILTAIEGDPQILIEHDTGSYIHNSSPAYAVAEGWYHIENEDQYLFTQKEDDQPEHMKAIMIIPRW